jgi:DNA polymerase III delta subunit
MEGWVSRRADELGVSLAPGAAKAIAEKVGAFVREGDVDRRRQSELANSELEKLALYRPEGQGHHGGRRRHRQRSDPGLDMGLP